MYNMKYVSEMTFTCVLAFLRSEFSLHLLTCAFPCVCACVCESPCTPGLHIDEVFWDQFGVTVGGG